MEDTPFSNREILAMFHSIDEKQDQTIAQTTKTNGRVTSLENKAIEQAAGARIWRAVFATAITMLTGIIVPVAIALHKA